MHLNRINVHGLLVRLGRSDASGKRVLIFVSALWIAILGSVNWKV